MSVEAVLNVVVDPRDDFVDHARVRHDLHDMAARCADSADAERYIRDAATLGSAEFTVRNVVILLILAHRALQARIKQIEWFLAAKRIAPDPVNPWAAPMAVRLALAETLVRAYLTEPRDAFPLATRA